MPRVRIFPRSSPSKTKYVLPEYLALDKKADINTHENSRRVPVSKNLPGVWLAEHSVGLLSIDDVHFWLCVNIFYKMIKIP